MTPIRPPAGQRTGPELRLNSRLIDHPAGVSVMGLADASFVALWLEVTPGSTGTAVLRARRFSPPASLWGPTSTSIHFMSDCLGRFWNFSMQH
jgi:hypothetical protein